MHAEFVPYGLEMIAGHGFSYYISNLIDCHNLFDDKLAMQNLLPNKNKDQVQDASSEHVELDFLIEGLY